MGEKRKAGGSKNGQFNQTGKQLHEPAYKYADKKEPKNKGEPLSKEIEKSAPNANLQTTILAQKGLKDIASVVAQFDPQGTGQIAPQMYPMLQQIFTAIAAGNGRSNSGSGSDSEDIPPNPDTKNAVEEALTDALSILANKYTFIVVVDAFNQALQNNQIDLIDAEYRDNVKNALANLYNNYAEYGEGKLPYFVPITFNGPIGEEPSPIVEIVPDLYVQQYYLVSLDPYFGFIQWTSQESGSSVYTRRIIGEPYYITPEEEIRHRIQQELVVVLEPHIQENTLTAKIINDAMASQIVTVEKEKKEKTSGKNSSSNLMSVLMKLAGYAGQIISKQQSTQLPQSVLNKGSIGKSQNKFMENIGKMKLMKEKGKLAGAMTPPSLSLSGNVLSSVASKIGSSSNVAKVQTLYNIIKSQGVK